MFHLTEQFFSVQKENLQIQFSATNKILFLPHKIFIIDSLHIDLEV